MSNLTALDDDILDDDGYPTEAAVALIPTWTGTPERLVADLLEPIFSGYGSVRVERITDDFDRPVMAVRLATGGWSGCEEAIGALKKGLFWFAWWESSRRGGAYTFQVPAAAWTSPMVAWPQPPDWYDRGVADGRAQVRDAVAALHARRAHTSNGGVRADGLLDFAAYDQTDFADLCDHCRTAWPCPTALALGQAGDEADDESNDGGAR